MRSWFLAAAVVLAGCATHPAGPVLSTASPEWQAHQQQLEGLHDWRLSGRVGVSHGRDAWNGNLRWTQSGANYDIVLTSPLGQGGARLQGGPRYSELHVDDKVVVDADAESLLDRQFGWRLPVSGLRYWLVGLPSPASNNQLTLDHAGRLEKLRQDGWQVDFKRYTRVDGVELPGKLFVTHPEMQVRLVVDRWDVAG